MTRRALITGVHGGIGSATAEVFRDAGWAVAGTDLRDRLPSPVLDTYLDLDLATADAADVFQHFVDDLGTLDALVNCAAIQIEKPFVETSVDEWDSVMAANVRAVFWTSRAASRLLRASGGAIVNVGSVHSVATSAGVAAYAASKGALMAFTRSAALELAPTVRVNAVLPGAVDTPMLRSGIGRWSTGDQMEAAMGELAARTPLARIARPKEIAQAILFLADADRSSFITGQGLVVDGGATARLSTE